MRDTIEMAREAGFPFNKYGLLQGDGDGEIDADKMFKDFEALVRADERERMYGKDIDTLLFEEHRLGFEKGSRSERETCAKLCDEARAARLAEQIRARGETK
jgi:MoaA/NifB/PqqE/SkfB family radical SAM enzyme